MSGRLGGIDPRDPVHAEWIALGLEDLTDDVKNYKARLERERALGIEGKGPVAHLARLMLECGYRSPWRPALPSTASQAPFPAPASAKRLTGHPGSKLPHPKRSLP